MRIVRRAPLPPRSRREVVLWLAAAVLVTACGGLTPGGAEQSTTERPRAVAFQHPGVFVSREQLDFARAQVAAHAEPFYTQFLHATQQTAPTDTGTDSVYGGTAAYRLLGPPATGIIDCGPSSDPDHGCHAENADAATAYLQAVLWYLTGDRAHANNAIRILDTYARALKGYTGKNAPLQAAWGGSKWARAAEIIRHSDAGWPEASAAAFGDMMRSAVLPQIYAGSNSNGNWELSMIEAMIGMAVYDDDAALFDHAVALWRARVPRYFYLHTDGAQPVGGSGNWYGQPVFDANVDGVCQETCRDFGHSEYGIAAAIAAAETAHIQGLGLYEAEQARLAAALEFHAFYLLGNPVPGRVCNGKVALDQRPTFEVGYNALHNRLGVSLPSTGRWLQAGVRVKNPEVENHMMIFETLTHGADAGVAPAPACATVEAAWRATHLGARTGAFMVTFSATPSAAGINAVLGLSSGAASDYTGVAAMVRFNPDGRIDARDGAAYVAGAAIPYAAGQAYRFRLAIDLAARRYSAYVTPPGGAEVTIGADLAFRTEQQAVASLDTLSAFAKTGAVTLCAVAPCVPVGAAWQGGGVTPRQGTFTLRFQAFPSAAAINSVIGLAGAAPAGYADVAANVRFGPAGTIDARDGGAYVAAAAIPYAAGAAYGFRLTVDVPNHRYSAFVTGADGAERTIGADLAFRTEQQATGGLGRWAAYAQDGESTVCAVEVQ